jgi:ubiquinol-cytochrome c reductase subunit 8
MKQKGIISYGVAPNRQYPLAGAAHDAFFNTWRRFSTQVLYWAPPMIAGYYIVNWAVDRYDLGSNGIKNLTLTGCQEPLPQLEAGPRRVRWPGGVRAI